MQKCPNGHRACDETEGPHGTVPASAAAAFGGRRETPVTSVGSCTHCSTHCSSPSAPPPMEEMGERRGTGPSRGAKAGPTGVRVVGAHGDEVHERMSTAEAYASRMIDCGKGIEEGRCPTLCPHSRRDLQAD